MQAGRCLGSAVLVTVLACVPGWARVTINQPQADDTIGRFIDVAGKASPQGTVAVSFEVLKMGQQKAVYEAPPTIVATDESGAFKLRLALPPVKDRADLLCTVTAREAESETAESAQVTVALAATEAGGKALDPAIPLVTRPAEGSAVGPGTDVEGRAKPGQVVIIWAKCFDAETGEQLGDVPGIRHLPKEDGSFRFRIATPRAILREKARARYEIRVFSATPDYQSPTIYIHVTAAE